MRPSTPSYSCPTCGGRLVPRVVGTIYDCARCDEVVIETMQTTL